MELIATLQADFRRKQAIFSQDGADVSLFRVMLADGSSANILYRLMGWFCDLGLSPIAMIFQWLNKLLNGCVIGLGASFEPGLVIMHPVGIVINSKVTGGSNITLESGVVIGDNHGFSPRLANNIFIGSGAKIFGQLTVADDVNIGANAVLTKDAPAGATMLGIPARPYSKENS